MSFYVFFFFFYHPELVRKGSFVQRCVVEFNSHHRIPSCQAPLLAPSLVNSGEEMIQLTLINILIICRVRQDETRAPAACERVHTASTSPSLVWEHFIKAKFANCSLVFFLLACSDKWLVLIHVAAACSISVVQEPALRRRTKCSLFGIICHPAGGEWWHGCNLHEVQSGRRINNHNYSTYKLKLRLLLISTPQTAGKAASRRLTWWKVSFKFFWFWTHWWFIDGLSFQEMSSSLWHVEQNSNLAGRNWWWKLGKNTFSHFHLSWGQKAAK